MTHRLLNRLAASFVATVVLTTLVLAFELSRLPDSGKPLLLAEAMPAAVAASAPR
ncbi:hypothetical protein [Pelomonas sp. SE-A7]|uniref:hypothetical protein n=1 Tax=Pelomonas sp. SE-A7 TaxID=3054953 RepID=UPI00259CE03D|nr:hypothetical protein [Pelomonas sp. SE-A7]MDM4768365.1 hypothetical protein [Pelomonas sp. SE-A7]